jgi:hypothetical protein
MSGDKHKPIGGSDPVQNVSTEPTKPQSSAKRHPVQDKKAGDNKGAEPGELLTGQADPGLTLTGGGGHA